MNYSNITPIISRIPADRQGAKRHYGVHPYFTRRPYNVIRTYVTHYTNEGDRVMDPFGGSGVTAIEAFLENRKAFHNDINPLANFIASGVYELHKVCADDLFSAVNIIETNCKQTIEEIYKRQELSIDDYAGACRLPPNIRLPGNSDVEFYYDLFLPYQLVSLAVLKDEIDRFEDPSLKHALLLAWSSTLTKLNKTFISAKGRAASRGGSSIFSIYRYKVAKDPVILDPWASFHERFMNIVKAHKEIKNIIDFKNSSNGWSGEMNIYSCDVDELPATLGESFDYIITDPPYGGHISYLDLSLLWNNWLGLLPEESQYNQELIVGGSRKILEEHYVNRLHDSIRTCLNLLRDGRWFSIIFQHWNIKYFETILSAAEESKAELESAISQIGDPIWSMHKKKGKKSVMAGEFILTFYKGNAISRKKSKSKDASLPEIVDSILDDYDRDTIYGEYLINMVILKAWRYGVIEAINIKKDEVATLLKEKGWRYDQKKHYWVRNSDSAKGQNEFIFEERKKQSG